MRHRLLQEIARGDVDALRKWRKDALRRGVFLDAMAKVFGSDIGQARKYYEERAVAGIIEQAVRERLNLARGEGATLDFPLIFERLDDTTTCKVMVGENTKSEVDVRTLLVFCGITSKDDWPIIPPTEDDEALERLALACLRVAIRQRFEHEPWLWSHVTYSVDASAKVCLGDGHWGWQLQIFLTANGNFERWRHPASTITLPWERRLDVPYLVQEFQKLEVRGM